LQKIKERRIGIERELAKLYYYQDSLLGDLQT